MCLLEYKVAPTRHGQVGYVTFGYGEVPLIMLIGYTGTLFHWNKHLVGQLAKSYKIYLVDNRHVGLTKTANEASMLGMANDVNEFIETIGLVRPWILGWSMGGMVAQELACNYSNNLSGLILMATMPSYSYINEDFINLLIRAESMSELAFKRELYWFFFSETDFEHKVYNLKANALNFANYPYRYTIDAKQFQDSVAVVWGGISYECYQRIKVPILVLRAKNDLVVNDQAAHKILEFHQTAKYIEYQSGGHFLVHKNPCSIANDISNFIAIQPNVNNKP